MSQRRSRSIATAAAMAGFSTATGYRLTTDPNPPVDERVPRGSRRPDPLAGLFESEVVPMLQAAPALRPIAVFIELQRRHPTLQDAMRRTIERRIRTWRALNGPEQDVIFAQVQVPGRMGLSDFTVADELKVTLQGIDFAHRLYHFRLAYSGFAYASVVLGGESYAALEAGLQNALWSLGGVPREHRTDSLSAAFKNLTRAAGDDITRRYDALCAHYAMLPTRNQRGIARENGAVESPHGHLKRAIEDALLLRGSRDFGDVTDYRQFIDELISRRNAQRRGRIEVERSVLQPLPRKRQDEGEEAQVVVTRNGGFTLRKVFYTVPSRLIGHRMRVRLHDDRIDVHIGTSKLMTLARGRAGPRGALGHVVDYRHVIHALRRKPMAFMNLAYRDQLFPRVAYKRAFDALLDANGPAIACRAIVALLALAHERACEADLAVELDCVLDRHQLPDVKVLTERFTPQSGVLPTVNVDNRELDGYDGLASVFDESLSDEPASEV